MKRKTRTTTRFKKLLNILGPGLVTGASDDDPSGIATYSQAGAQFGFSTLWTALITFPLMAAIQGMCARIGVVTTKGLTGTLREHYPRVVLWLMIIFSFPAIVLNIGADIAGMGAVAHLILPAVPSFAFCILFTGLILFGIIYFPYQKFASILKYICLILVAYLVLPFFVKIDWHAAMLSSIIPTIHFNKEFIIILVAILGTTISPYLFFWQATMEAEDMKKFKRRVIVNRRILTEVKQDVNLGMFFSNLVMWFIILTCGAVLFKNGIHKIDTVEQAASALKPIAGNGAYSLFALGVIGTGFLAIPVLSGSISYMLAETFRWQNGLDKRYYEAKPFYGVIIVSLLLGLGINYLGISPVQGLIYTAILYGITAPVLILIILHICNNKKIMGKHVNNPFQNILGWITFVLMFAAAVVLIYFYLR
jgi:NRAMP (natural resistance-associated macrophage protein)-like metal ion transporter